MLAFLITGFVSSALTYASARAIKKKNAVFLSIIAVTCICIFAGIRDDSVGTDTLLYGVPGFESAKIESWDVWYSNYAGWHPLGFCLLTWVTAHVIPSRIFYFSMLQLLVILPIYYSIWRNNKNDAWIGIFVYSIFLLPVSLNLMKQMIAVAFCILSFDYAQNERFIPFIVCVCTGSLFHFSALFFLPVYLLMLSWNRRDKIAATIAEHRLCFLVLIAFLLLTTVTVVINFKEILRLAWQIKPSLGVAYLGFGDGELYESALALLAGTILCGCYLMRHSEWRDSVDGVVVRSYPMVLLILITGLLMMQLDVVADTLSRLSLFGLGLCPLFATQSYALAKHSSREHRLACLFTLFFMMLVVAYSVYTFGITGAQQVCPYSTIL